MTNPHTTGTPDTGERRRPTAAEWEADHPELDTFDPYERADTGERCPTCDGNEGAWVDDGEGTKDCHWEDCPDCNGTGKAQPAGDRESEGER